MIAISISVVCCIIYIKRNYPILRLKKEDWAYNPAFMREHLNIAIPMSIQFSILALSIMVIQAVCNSFGEKIIVGFTIALRIEQLATQPLMAIGLAMATFAAQNYGAGKLSRIREAVKKACLTSFVISLLMSTVMFFSAPISSAAFWTIRIRSSFKSARLILASALCSISSSA